MKNDDKKRIREVLTERGITVEEISRLTGLSISRIAEALFPGEKDFTTMIVGHKFKDWIIRK